MAVQWDPEVSQLKLRMEQWWEGDFEGGGEYSTTTAKDKASSHPFTHNLICENLAALLVPPFTTPYPPINHPLASNPRHS